MKSQQIFLKPLTNTLQKPQVERLIQFFLDFLCSSNPYLRNYIQLEIGNENQINLARLSPEAENHIPKYFHEHHYSLYKIYFMEINPSIDNIYEMLKDFLQTNFTLFKKRIKNEIDEDRNMEIPQCVFTRFTLQHRYFKSFEEILSFLVLYNKRVTLRCTEADIELDELFWDTVQDGVRTPSAKGLALLDQYHQIKDGKIYPSFIFENKSDFYIKLKMINEWPSNMDLVFKIFNETFHCQAIKLERRDGVNHFIILDSMGNGNTHARIMRADIKKNLPEALVSFGIEVRQWDKFSCPIFSIKDARQMMKYPNLFLFADKNIILTSGFTTPPQMMTLTQSSTVINEYKKNERLSNEDTKVLSHQIEKFSKPTEIEGVLKNYNTKALHYVFKYEEKIKEIFKQNNQGELKKIIAMRNGSNLTMENLNEIAEAQSLQEKSSVNKASIATPTPTL